MQYTRVFRPKFFHLFQQGRYDKNRFVADLTAGIVVGILALPLAIAFGIASGVSPQQGLITAIVAGFVISIFGGSRFLIGGPTGAFIVIVAGIVAKYGMTGLAIATIMAGIMLVVMGFCRLGVVFKFIPYPIVVGFTSGIALTIFSTQMKDFFGMQDISVPSGFVSEWGCYLSNLSSINPAETMLSLFCLLTIILWNRFGFKKIPGALVAIIVGTGASLVCDRFLGIGLATIGTKFPELASGMPLPQPVVPQFDFNDIRELVSPAFTIALLCAIESLMAAMVADGVTGKQHDSNTELIAQGVANIVTPLFGGIPATGALARTMASINNGARTSVAGIIHAVVLLLIYLFLMPYIVYVPLSCLAAILVVVAYNMSGWRSFRYLLKGDKTEVAVLLITFFLTVIVDLTVAIEVGILMSIVLFVTRTMQTSTINVIDHDTVLSNQDDSDFNPEDTEHLDVHAGVEIYEINGPYFFGLGSRTEEFRMNRSDGLSLCKIVRMRKVPFMDSTGVQNLKNLIDMAGRRGVTVLLSGVNPDVMNTLKNYGVDKLIGKDHIFGNIMPALEYANALADKKKSAQQ